MEAKQKEEKMTFRTSGEPELRDVSDLVTHPESQEIYQEEEVEEAFLESVREKGVLEPLKVTDKSYFLPEETGVVVSGNRRKAAAQKLGIGRVPVVPLEFSSELQEKEAILTFNLQRNKTFSQKMREATSREPSPITDDQLSSPGTSTAWRTFS